MKLHHILLPAILAATPAFAADLVNYSAPPEPAATHFDWTGGYIGANLGYTWGDVDYSSAAGNGSMSPDGLIGGLQAGYNWQFGNNFVLGAEIGGSILDANDNTTDAAGIESRSSSKWGATARLRAGYAANSWLFYVSGGGAIADAKGTTIVPGLGSDSDSKTLSGWVAGAGVEKMLTRHVSVRLDWSHYDYGSETLNYNFGGGIGGSSDIDVTADIVTAGVNYRF